MDLHPLVLIFFTEQMVVVGVECKSHNSSCSKMSRAELERGAGEELVNLILGEGEMLIISLYLIVLNSDLILPEPVRLERNQS